MTTIDTLPIKLRLLRGLDSQEMAAQKACIGVKTWSSFETGMRTHGIRVRDLEAICLAYEMTLIDFLKWEPADEAIGLWREYDERAKIGRARARCYEAIVVDPPDRRRRETKRLRLAVAEPSDAELDEIAKEIMRR